MLHSIRLLLAWQSHFLCCCWNGSCSLVALAASYDAYGGLQAEVGLRSSAGIASNKLLAKLASGLHKPDDQTVLPPPEAAAFLAPLPVRCAGKPRQTAMTMFAACLRRQQDMELTVAAASN